MYFMILILFRKNEQKTCLSIYKLQLLGVETGRRCQNAGSRYSEERNYDDYYTFLSSQNFLLRSPIFILLGKKFYFKVN